MEISFRKREPYLDSKIFQELVGAFLSTEFGIKTLELTDGLNTVQVSGRDIVLSTYTHCDDQKTSRFLVQKLKKIVNAVSKTLSTYKTPWNTTKYRTYIRRCRQNCHGGKPLDIIITGAPMPDTVQLMEDEDINAAIGRVGGVYPRDAKCVLSNIIINLSDSERCDAFGHIFAGNGLFDTITRFAFIAEPAFINVRIEYWDGRVQRATLENKLTFSYARYGGRGSKRGMYS